MVSPELRILAMDPETRAIRPTEYEGVKLVSFGFAGQGSAIMRGAMVSGLITQMLTTAEWGETPRRGQPRACALLSVLPRCHAGARPGTLGCQPGLHAPCARARTRCPRHASHAPAHCTTTASPRTPGELDYLVVDFPPGTGDIQLTLCQTVAFSAAVVVTTPQRLAFVDVAKGVRMFAKLSVPVAAVVENMSFFDGDDGKRYRPFGTGSGAAIQADFGIPHLIAFPIVQDLSLAGDGA